MEAERYFRRKAAWAFERSLDALAAFLKEEVSPGQRARIVDIDANAGRGMGVWHRVHPAGTPPARFSFFSSP